MTPNISRSDMQSLVGRSSQGTGYENTPIFRLHEDVLLRIFLENADFYQEERLTTERQSSQVCRYWREVLLRSPLIWGRLIDLNDPSSTRTWIREVMSRAAHALVWIRGAIKFPDLLLPFIEDSWERIERLVVTAPDDQPQFWDALFKHPAPNLKEFGFLCDSFSRYVGYSFDPTQPVVQRSMLWFPPGTIFNDTAPVLKKFELRRRSNELTYHRPGHTLDMPMTWLSRLRVLSVRWTLDADALLAVLDSTPFLEDLEMGGFNAECSNQKAISLPRLASLRFEECSDSFMTTFLECVTARSPGCCLSISKAAACEPQFAYRLLTLVAAYIEDYFFEHAPTRVSISFAYHPFFEMKDHSTASSRSQRLSIINIMRYDDIIQSLLDSPCFGCVRELDLYSWRAAPMFSILGFTSVTTLITGSENLALITQGASSAPMLPRLQVVKIAEGDSTHFETLFPRFPEYAHWFLQQRRDAGLRVNITLDLSALQPKDLLYDLENLEEFHGLCVRWRTSTFDPEGSKKEYICGSEYPEQLCFEKERSTEGYFNSIAIGCGPPIYVQGWSGETA
ncbi:hypothetical protein D9613_010883 [Agrocybe pediades]|uniref:F-box domain-containing protein n=1 Tax=Agrocybe pediades TaxID=84607 RepID=A0A8H4VJH5_9AGAR|nr:hypothetical protein D9613_010883 [Agrocybe pediades]